MPEQVVCLHRYNFAAKQQEVEQLRAVTLKQIRTFYAAYIPQAAHERRRLAVHVVSNSHQEAEPESINDLIEHKAGLKPCVLPQSSLARA